MSNGNLCTAEMGRGFSVIYRHGRIMHDKAVKHFGLTGQQMGYLRYINEHPGTSQEELAKNMHIDKGAVAKAVRDMVDKGYIRREQNPQDKRAYCLFTGDKAVDICRCGEAHAAEFERRLTEGMTEEEIMEFKILLKKITDNMAKMLEGGMEF